MESKFDESTIVALAKIGEFSSNLFDSAMLSYLRTDPREAVERNRICQADWSHG